MFAAHYVCWSDLATAILGTLLGSLEKTKDCAWLLQIPLLWLWNWGPISCLALICILSRFLNAQSPSLNALGKWFNPKLWERLRKKWWWEKTGSVCLAAFISRPAAFWAHIAASRSFTFRQHNPKLLPVLTGRTALHSSSPSSLALSLSYLFPGWHHQNPWLWVLVELRTKVHGRPQTDLLLWCLVSWRCPELCCNWFPRPAYSRPACDI